MKKLLLLLAAGSFAGTASAQSSVVFTEGVIKATSLPQGFTQAQLEQDFLLRKAERMQANLRSAGNAAKGARTDTRTYNYVDLLSTQTPDILNNQGFSYMWNSFDGLANYSSGYDTINTVSFGQLIQPYYNKWNSLFAFPGMPELRRDASYRLDTVKMYGVYPHNPNKPNVVDTMKFSFFYGNGSAGSNVVFDYRTPDSSITTANYGLDTLRFAYARYDSANTRAMRNTSGAAIITINVPLPNPYNDSLDNGLRVIRVPVGMDIPAGNIVGMTYSFKTGDPAFTPYDTVLLASGTNQVQAKYNMFRPRVFEQNASAYPTYYADSNYNNGLLRLYPLGGSSRYLAMYFLTAPSAGEFSDVDFVISSNEFETYKLVVNAGQALVIAGKAYPNPANSNLTVPVTVNANTHPVVTITNAIGQVLMTQDLGNVQAGMITNAKFDISVLSSGIYFCTVEAAGQRQTQRITIL